MSQKLFLLAVAGLAFLWSIRNWRKAVAAAMVLLVVEGAIRKWVFPGSQQLIYFGKDVLVAGCLVGYWRDRRSIRGAVAPAPGLVMLLSLAAAWAALEIFNPNLPNLLVGILGFKAYFLYVPLMVVVPACFHDDRQIATFLSRYALIAIPVGLLALAQFASPASSSINTYARSSGGEVAYVATFGSSEHVRVTGTFSFITGYTSFLLAITILLLGLFGSTGWRLARQRKLSVALGLTLLGMLMSGSRGPVFMLAALFPFYWYLAVLRERDTNATVGRAILALGVVMAAVGLLAGDALGAFLGRAAGSSDVQGRLFAPIASPWALLPDVGLFGFGTGSAHQMASAVAPSIIPYSWLRGLMAESESGKIMIELGPVGFLLIYASRILLLVLAFGYAKTLRTRFHRSLATVTFLYFLAQLPGAPVFDVTSGLYYWFFAGLMLLAVRLDQVAAPSAAGTRQASAADTRNRPLPSPAPAPAWQTSIARRS